jgi:hypothetical protein
LANNSVRQKTKSRQKAAQNFPLCSYYCGNLKSRFASFVEGCVFIRVKFTPTPTARKLTRQGKIASKLAEQFSQRNDLISKSTS